MLGNDLIGGFIATFNERQNKHFNAISNDRWDVTLNAEENEPLIAGANGIEEKAASILRSMPLKR